MAQAKRGVGRPRKEMGTTSINFRIENDLWEWIEQARGDKKRTQFINDLIRKEAKL